jgi:hypothetical protein
MPFEISALEKFSDIQTELYYHVQCLYTLSSIIKDKRVRETRIVRLGRKEEPPENVIVRVFRPASHLTRIYNILLLKTKASP